MNKITDRLKSLYALHTKKPWFGYLAAVAFILLISSSPAVTRLAVTRTLTPYDMIALRCGIGGLILLPYFLMHLRTFSTKLLLMGFVLACLQGWGVHLTSAFGLQYAPAGHASALGPGASSVWVALWGWVFYRTRLAKAQRLGLILIVLGVAVLLVASTGTGFDQRTLIGDALFISASASGAFYITYIQKHQIPPLKGASLVAVYSGIVFLPFFLFTPIESKFLEAPIRELILQVIYQGVVAGALLVVLIGFCVVRLGAQRFTMLVSCVPVLGLLFGRLIVGDGITMLESIAIALISTGALYGALRQRTSSHEAQAREEPESSPLAVPAQMRTPS